VYGGTYIDEHLTRHKALAGKSLTRIRTTTGIAPTLGDRSATSTPSKPTGIMRARHADRMPWRGLAAVLCWFACGLLFASEGVKPKRGDIVGFRGGARMENLEVVSFSEELPEGRLRARPGQVLLTRPRWRLEQSTFFPISGQLYAVLRPGRTPSRASVRASLMWQRCPEALSLRATNCIKHQQPTRQWTLCRSRV